MNKYSLTLIFVLCYAFAKAQVGIGNTDPQATLDITASSAANPSNEDGILIPRIDEFPTIDPTATQDGMLVFVTGNGTPSKGFYYWDQTTATWTAVMGTVSGGGTLDEAYNFGGAGAGRIITATDGALEIAGEDGLLVTGTTGSGDAILVTGLGTRLFFNPRKAAFRAGRANNTEWDDSNVGIYSSALGIANIASGTNAMAFNGFNTASGFSATALGNGSIASGSASLSSGNLTVASGTYATAFNGSTEASGLNSVAFGNSSTASGSTSSVFGINNTSPSYAETSIGTYNTTYTPASATSYNSDDRIFSIGNGTGVSLRSNALTIYKSGLMNINDAYNMPTADGTNGQVMTTDGAGNVTFQDAAATTDTDDQQIDVLNLNGTTLEISLEDDGVATQTLDVSSLQDGDTQNNLNQAYNEGGAGAGATIDATDGAVTINGTDGLLVTGTLGSGNTIDTEITGAGVRMFFNPNTASFRAGQIDGNQWNQANIGDRSVAFGNNNTASGNASAAFGATNTSSGNRSSSFGEEGVASGQNSFTVGEENTATRNESFAQGFRSNATGTTAVAMGLQNNAPSYGEMTVGSFASTYTPAGTTTYNANDRIFTVGNGTSGADRSNALTILKNGIVNINDSYNMPVTDGTNGQ